MSMAMVKRKKVADTASPYRRNVHIVERRTKFRGIFNHFAHATISSFFNASDTEERFFFRVG